MYAIWASLAPSVKADVTRDSQWLLLEKQYQLATNGLFDQDVSASEQNLQSTPKLPGNSLAGADFHQTRMTGFARDGWSL